MAFSLDKVRGLSGIGSNNGSLQVGAGLLNDASKKLAKYKQTEYILPENIEPNPKNEMSMGNIEELADLINLTGLEQPLVVYPLNNGKYRILTGHRRFEAIKLLISQKKWKEDDPIECKVTELDDLDLPLSLEEKEDLKILISNKYREKTDADIAREIRNWKKIIEELRNNGVTFLALGIDEDGNKIGRDMKGVRTQVLVAEQVGISKSQVANFEKVDSKGSEELKAALDNNKISVSTAAAVADMPVEEQKILIKEAIENKSENEKITMDDVNIAKHNKETKPKDIDIEIKEGCITDKVFKDDIKKLQKYLKSNENGVQLSDSKYADYLRYINGLNKIFGI